VPKLTGVGTTGRDDTTGRPPNPEPAAGLRLAAAHPADGQPHHEVYLRCDDIDTTVAELAAKGAEFTDGVVEQPWGLSTTLKLPGGGQISLYQPTHPSPLIT
jgi:predicted enzyme related to lactoylglutathione lyase